MQGMPMMMRLVLVIAVVIALVHEWGKHVAMERASSKDGQGGEKAVKAAPVAWAS